MNIKHLLAAFGIACAALAPSEAVALKYAGGDISMLPEYDNATYFTPNGARVSDFLSYCSDQGMNAMRVRLFVDPSKYTGSEWHENTYQTLDYIIPICQRIKEAGCALMLDFHYSDTWADPAKQFTPADWENLNDTQLYDRIYTYTKECLRTLAANGISPDMIQTGNEISYGMLWGREGSSYKKIYASNDSNWTRFITLLENAIKACREECPEAKIVIHTERTPQPWYLQQFYAKLSSLDYDIIGLSYYQYYHGSLGVLDSAISTLEADFPTKKIMVVETGYPYAWSMLNGGTEDFDPSLSGQNAYTQALVDLLNSHANVNGVFWWWPEYNAKGLNLSGWYNAPLVDSNTGYITPALATLATYADNTPEEEVEPDPSDPSQYPDFYIVYNKDSGSWSYPGDKLTHIGDGNYTLSNVRIAGENNGDGWFTLATKANSWNDVEANRYGPETDSQKLTMGVPSKVVKDNQTSWNVPAGNYDVSLNYPDMLLTLSPYGSSLGIDFTGVDSETPVYFNMQGIRIQKPEKGIYIRVSKGKASLICQ